MPTLQMLFQPLMDIDRIEADAEEGRFRLRATGGGFFAKLFGMGTKAVVTADSHGFRLQKTTFGADENTYIPRSQIASTVCVVAKPLEFLVLGLFTLPLLGLGLIFLLVYFFAKRRVIVGVVSSGGTVESVKLKATVDHLDDIREGMKILERLLRDEATPGPPTAVTAQPARPVAARPARSPPPPPPPVAGNSTLITCPSCGTRMNLPASAAGRKVRCTSCREVFTASADE